MRASSAPAAALLVLALILAVPFIGYGAEAAPWDVVVKGRLVTGFDANGNIVGLEGATITLTDSVGTEYTDVSDADGYFEIEAPPGTDAYYLVTIDAAGYDVLAGHPADVDATSASVGEVYDLGDIAMAPFPVTGDVTVTGRLVTVFDSKNEKTGLEGGTVTLTDTLTLIPYTDVSNTNGEFEITVPLWASYSITVESAGYGILAGPANIDTTGHSDGDVIILGDIAMAQTFGTVTGTVTFNGDPVIGARVSIIAQSGLTVRTAWTDGHGEFTVMCATGTYSISVTDARFKTFTVEDAEILPGSNMLPDIEMERKDVDTYLFGLDLPHTLMVVGGIIGLFILFFVVSYRIHISKHPDQSKIYSDPKKKDQE